MSNDLDELMSRDPLELSSQDIDAIIDFHRKARARRASGEKVTKPKIDVQEILSKTMAKPVDANPIKRRI